MPKETLNTTPRVTHRRCRRWFGWSSFGVNVECGGPRVVVTVPSYCSRSLMVHWWSDELSGQIPLVACAAADQKVAVWRCCCMGQITANPTRMVNNNSQDGLAVNGGWWLVQHSKQVRASSLASRWWENKWCMGSTKGTVTVRSRFDINRGSSVSYGFRGEEFPNSCQYFIWRQVFSQFSNTLPPN